MQIVLITLSHRDDDDPQLIFESLNATGLALEESDKIRNYILMDLPQDEQKEFYKYWKIIEKNANNDVSSFIRDYFSVNQKSIPNIKNVHFRFKEYYNNAINQGKNRKKIILEILDYSRLYQKLIAPCNIEISKLDGCIYRLNRIKTTVTRPFLMEVLRLNKERQITDDDTLRVFLQTESYVFRRWVYGVVSNALSKIFVHLHWDIMDFDNTEKNYYEKFIYIDK